MTAPAAARPWTGSPYEPEHELFRETVREFIAREVLPHDAEWDRAGIVPRELYRKAAEQSIVGFEVPEEFGGAGIEDFRFNAIIAEEIARAAVTGSMLGIVLHNDVCMPYFLRYASAEQRERWLPGIASGELVTAIAMTEPGTGSDLQGIQTTARRDGDVWKLSGSKTFITNGIHADLIIVCACTDREAGPRGFTLFVVERDMPGFARGRNLEKIGLHAQDTAELFFDEVELTDDQVLGEVGLGFMYLMSNLVQEACRSPSPPRRAPPPRWSALSSTCASAMPSASLSARCSTSALSWPTATPRWRWAAPTSTSACSARWRAPSPPRRPRSRSGA